MRLTSILTAATLGLATLGAGAAKAADEACVRQFAQYDWAVKAFDNVGWSDNSPIVAPAVSRSIQRLRAENCLTSWDQLAFAQQLGDELRGTLKGEHGAPIRPTTLQAGVVLGISSELQARQFFASLGYRVRSQGAPYMGRRIYIGPFTTAGGLAEAYAVAERAGFVAPYPRRF